MLKHFLLAKPNCSTQWAAVINQLLSIIVAPHIKEPSVTKACHGQLFGNTSKPPIILICSIGLISGIPQAV